MPRSYVREKRTPDVGLRKRRVLVRRWVDPFPWIQGSEPEKMVMAEFVRRGIYFEHTPQKNSLAWPSWAKDVLDGTDPATLEADFMLPQYHIWLEVQGAYFHTLPGRAERDALRFALVEAAGWRPIFWWEDDIRNRLAWLFDQVPEFYRVDFALNLNKNLKRTPGQQFYEGGEGIDHLAGLRKALANRTKPPQRVVVRRKKKKRLAKVREG